MSLLREGLADGRLVLSPKERQWLDRIDRELSGMPATGEELLQEFIQDPDAKFDPASYGLTAPPAVL